MTVFYQPDAVDRIANTTLIAGDWDDGAEAVCMMSALVSGAKSPEDCLTAGWPKWLVSLNITLFDANTDGCDYTNNEARTYFALLVAKSIHTPRDLDTARDRFLIAMLATSQFSALNTIRSLGKGFERHWHVIDKTVELLVRRLDGHDVSESVPVIQKELAEIAYETTRSEVHLACRAASVALGHDDSVYRVLRCIVSMSTSNAVNCCRIEDVAAARLNRERAVFKSAREELVMALKESPANEGFH